MTRWSAPIGLVVAGPLRGGAKRRGGAGARSILAAVFLSVSERSSRAEPGERITRGQMSVRFSRSPASSPSNLLVSPPVSGSAVTSPRSSEDGWVLMELWQLGGRSRVNSTPPHTDSSREVMD
ncbi:hypothetical protein EYF80_019682 [Liparis tanakae]|uniref:Uncharacterized protein n=1 Tax=Liparis tanakae TaxID=230148 RepID=A0A4Z2HVX8_9TELE|nr:hypothetical protein EYF80_019682 [Liparis tanakae]